jgi:autotransporter-associated beta strand protein
MSGMGALTKLGAGTLTVADLTHFGGATTVAAGHLSVNGAVAGSVNVQSGGMFTLAGGKAPSGTVDVTTAGMVLDYPILGSNPVADVRRRIIEARGGTDLIGTWRGTGITSSAAAANSSALAVGYAANAELPLGPYTSFRGQPVDATSVLIRGTRIGDATLDGVVDDNDVTVIGATFGMKSGATWALGDFDYDGDVDDNDVTLVSAVYNPAELPIGAPIATVGGLTAVPEPASWLMLTCAGGAAGWFAGRRRRRRASHCRSAIERRPFD